jgi:hypothetical protein
MKGPVPTHAADHRFQDDAIIMVPASLPSREVQRCRTAPEVASAIRTMVIRGAPRSASRRRTGSRSACGTAPPRARASSRWTSRRPAISWPPRAPRR